jgi:hypothetical protein
MQAMEDTGRPARAPKKNGAALAAALAAGIGALAIGLFVLAHEAGIYSAPSLYAPAGGLSGRATFAVVVWLAAWVLLHAKWKDREVAAGRVLTWAMVLTGLGIVATMPPVWALL